MNRCTTPHQGFTLLELVVTVGVLAIIMAIAIPNMAIFWNKQRANGIANELTRDLSRARAEAMSANQCVSLCPTNAAATSCNGTDWMNGWIMFTNDSCNLTQNQPLIRAGERMLAIHQRSTTGSEFALAGTANRLMFSANGTARANTNQTIELTHKSGNDAYARVICINAAGRTSIKPKGATCS